MILIKNAEIYAPAYLGKKDVLLVNNKIVAIELEIPTQILEKFNATIIEAKGKKLLPGFIDAHVHIAGAGGEGGPATRTPEIFLSQLVSAGVTSVVGCLGTDGITRKPETVLMKAKALKADGISSYIFTGSYQVPTPTITGSIARDLALIDEVIGIGEIALSDHRSSHPSIEQLIQLMSEARVGALLGGKAGIANIHMGDAHKPFRPILEAVEKSELKIRQFWPTHCNRNHYIFEDAKDYGKKSIIDLTASSYPYFPEDEIKPSKALRELLEAGVPIENITLTSDAMGSLPSFDGNGNLVRLEIGQPLSIYTEMVDSINKENIPLEIALRTITSNVAAILKLPNKGKISVNADADLVLIDSDYNINTVIANGQIFVQEHKIIKRGTFEK